MNDEQRQIQQNALQEAIGLFGTQAKFAKKLAEKTNRNVTQQTISDFLHKGMNFKWAIPIEEITAELGSMVPRKRLRPDAYPD